MTNDDVRQALRSFILSNFLPGEAPETLKESTQLISSGILTSLSLLEVATFIEDKFGVTLMNEDIGVAKMDTLDRLVELVSGRRGETAG